MNDNYNATFDRLGKFVTDVMAVKRVPGVAVGILCKGETYTAGFGVTNVDQPISFTNQMALLSG